VITTSDMSKDFANALLAAHDADVRALSRMTRHELAVLERSELAARGTERIMGGPVTKDELINAITNMRYPIARQNEAIHVLHHDPQPGQVGTWSACEWCACQVTRHAHNDRLNCTVIQQCNGQPGHDGDHTFGGQS